mmetsp:Transcript_16705/g.35289  ORF Transcript_16705/g.35289 Transcript_16705/m.35289 type:complete len:89 (+) Transcript_16705:272-538(+)
MGISFDIDMLIMVHVVEREIERERRLIRRISSEGGSHLQHTAYNIKCHYHKKKRQHSICSGYVSQSNEVGSSPPLRPTSSKTHKKCKV